MGEGEGVGDGDSDEQVEKGNVAGAGIESIPVRSRFITSYLLDVNAKRLTVLVVKHDWTAVLGRRSCVDTTLNYVCACKCVVGGTLSRQHD